MDENTMHGQASAGESGQGMKGAGQGGMGNSQPQGQQQSGMGGMDAAVQGQQAPGMQGMGAEPQGPAQPFPDMTAAQAEAMYHAYHTQQAYPPQGMPYPPPGYGYAPPPPMYAYQPQPMGQGQMHGQQAHAQQSPGVSQIMEEIAGGGSGLASLTKLLDFDDRDFWKGALVGAAAVLLLTNENVQRTLFRGAVKTRDAAEGGAEKVKEGVEKVKQTVQKATVRSKTMSNYPVPQNQSQQHLHTPANNATCSVSTLANMALAGAVIGGSAAAAKNLRRVQQEEIQPREALYDTGKTALSSAAATAVATAAATTVAGVAANAVADRGLLRLSVMFGVGTAVLYGLNRWAENKSE